MIRHRYDPLAFVTEVLGFKPDAHQARILDPLLRKLVVCCPRGWGKTLVTSMRACWQLVHRPGTNTMVVSETAEKAAELVRLTGQHASTAGLGLSPDPLRKNGLIAENGARILPVPSRASRVRGYRAHLILVDEAACVPDKVYTAISGARAGTSEDSAIILMSTPGQPSGFFHRYATGDSTGFERLWIPATECDRYTRSFLDEERRNLPDDDFEREYMARYPESGGSFFDVRRFRAGISTAVPVLDVITRFSPTMYNLGGDRVLVGDNLWVPRNGFYLIADLGQARDYSTLAVLEYRVETLRSCDPVTRLPHCEAKFRLRWLQRFPLHTGYDDIAEIIADLIRHTELWQRCTVLVDATGVGRAFVDCLKRLKIGAPVKSIQITSGFTIRQQGDTINIPKRDMVMTMDRVLRKDLLETAAELPFLREFTKELTDFARIQMPGGTWGYSGKANGSDDLVMAVAMGLAYACLLHKPRSLEW